MIYIRVESKNLYTPKSYLQWIHKAHLYRAVKFFNQKKKVQNRLFIATLIQNIMVKIIDARNTIPAPQANVLSIPSKSMQWKVAPLRKKRIPNALYLSSEDVRVVSID